VRQFKVGYVTFLLAATIVEETDRERERERGRGMSLLGKITKEKTHELRGSRFKIKIHLYF
jgi:hypothetical protein